MGDKLPKPCRCPLLQLALVFALGRELLRCVEANQARPRLLSRNVDCIAISDRKCLLGRDRRNV